MSAQPQDGVSSCKCVLSAFPCSSRACQGGDAQPRRSRLSRTLSDVPSTEWEPSDPGPAQKATFDLSDNSVGSHGASNLPGSQSELFSNGDQEVEEEAPQLHSCGGDGSEAQGGEQTGNAAAAAFQLNGGGDPEAGSCDRKEARGSGGSHSPELIPMSLYLHRVKGLVLALLVEPHFLDDPASMEEVVSAPPTFTLPYLLCCFHFLFELGYFLSSLVPQQPGVPQRSGSPPQDRGPRGPWDSGPPRTLQLRPL